jgi:hypothetical protein
MFYKIYLQWIYWTLFFIARCSTIFAQWSPQGATFLKSFNVASSYCDKIQCKGFFLYWIWKNVIISWSKGCNIGRKEYQRHVVQFQGWKPQDLPNLAEANNMWRCNIQNHNHLSILAFEPVVELQNLGFKYIPLYPSCFIWMLLNIIMRLPPSKTSWLLRHLNHKQLQLNNPSWINSKSKCYTLLV